MYAMISRCDVWEQLYGALRCVRICYAVDEDLEHSAGRVETQGTHDGQLTMTTVANVLITIHISIFALASGSGAT